MNKEKRFAEWLEDFIDRRPFTGFSLVISGVTIVILIVIYTLYLIFGDDGQQKQVDFVNACTNTGKTAVIHYEHVLAGKTYTWKPVVECKS